MAVGAGRGAAQLSRRTGCGQGSVIAGRVALALRPAVLARLAAAVPSVIVTGTNGKTTTSHLLAEALRVRGEVAHNAGGSNMADGAVTALIDAGEARFAVLEVDELHLRTVLDAVRPAVLVLLNLSRDQLDRVSEVGATARTIRALLGHHPRTVVVANADDPWIVWAAGPADRVIWVAADTRWEDDSLGCPSCGAHVARSRGTDATRRWRCSGCGLTRPTPSWTWCAGPGTAATVHPADHAAVTLTLALPGRVNLGNATMALAAATELGVDPCLAAPRLARVEQAAGRYGVVEHRRRRARLLLVKNPAGWAEAMEMLVPGRPVLMMINAREADGRDVSWLWDLPLDGLVGRDVAVSGERAADLGVRLSYGGIAHHTDRDPRAALETLPCGDVDAVVNYTAFLDLGRVGAGAAGGAP